MTQLGYQEGGERACWWAVALHLDEAQLASVNALSHNVDDPGLVRALQDKLREAQAILLEIFNVKGLLPGALYASVVLPSPPLPIAASDAPVSPAPVAAPADVTGQESPSSKDVPAEVAVDTTAVLSRRALEQTVVVARNYLLLRVIFLDVDGVLNSEAYALKLEERHRLLGHAELSGPDRETCTCFKLYHQIDREAVARVNRIAAATGAKIVISSSWRKIFAPSELHRMLSEHGLVAEIIGATPDGNHDPELRTTFGYIDRIFRGHEIDLWLRKHPEVERFVIIDDDSDMVMHKNRLVQTDCMEGLLDEHVELAIQKLSWDGSEAAKPGSSTSLHCNEEGCFDTLELDRRIAALT